MFHFWKKPPPSHQALPKRIHVPDCRSAFDFSAGRLSLARNTFHDHDSIENDPWARKGYPVDTKTPQSPVTLGAMAAVVAVVAVAAVGATAGRRVGSSPTLPTMEVWRFQMFPSSSIYDSNGFYSQGLQPFTPFHLHTFPSKFPSGKVGQHSNWDHIPK